MKERKGSAKQKKITLRQATKALARRALSKCKQQNL